MVSSLFKNSISRLIVVIVTMICVTSCSQESEVTPPPVDNVESSLPSLSDTLASRAASADARSTPERLAINQFALDSLENSGILDQVLDVGDVAPDFTLNNASGNSISLYDELENGPVVLFWYRGGWCPYCNLNLQYMQRALPDFKALGASMMALTPELPDKSLSTSQKNELQFHVLTDLDNIVGKQYGVVYTLTDDVAKLYNEGFGLSEYNGNTNNELPLGVAFVVDTNRTIIYAYKDIDYRKRAEPSDILMALKQR